MSRDFTPRESYAFEQWNVQQGGYDIWEFMRRLTLQHDGQSERVYSDEEIALRQQFPVIGKILKPFENLYFRLSKINGGVDLLHRKDRELAEYIESGNGDVKLPLIKWFNGKLDPRFHYCEHNHQLFVESVLEEAKELSGEQKRLFEAYKQEWYKNHGVAEQDVACLKKEYEADVDAGRFNGSFESYELEFGYHGGEVYFCFEEFLDNEALDNRAGFLEDFFNAQHITMVIDVANGHLVAKDDEGNSWRDAEIYDFALNECLAFNEDGSLSDGLAAAEPFAERLKKDAKVYGVEITAIIKSVSSVLKDAQERSIESVDNSHEHAVERDIEKE